MNLLILGAKTLDHFTNAIAEGFKNIGIKVSDRSEASQPDLVLAQIHASPKGIKEDFAILQHLNKNNFKNVVILLHRPDELLLNSELLKQYSKTNKINTVFLGDLLLNAAPYNNENTTVIPHPFLSLECPRASSKTIVGAYTSWGEMRDIQHIVDLCHEISILDRENSIQFSIGGTLNGAELDQNLLNDKLSTFQYTPPAFEVHKQAFIPHFNIQLYHLNGKLRYGETSGSLHRGVSIPVIFEANGIERIEGLKVIKIDTNENLTKIEYKKAAVNILSLVSNGGVTSTLEYNLNKGKQNTVTTFASNVISLVQKNEKLNHDS